MGVDNIDNSIDKSLQRVSKEPSSSDVLKKQEVLDRDEEKIRQKEAQREENSEHRIATERLSEIKKLTEAIKELDEQLKELYQQKIQTEEAAGVPALRIEFERLKGLCVEPANRVTQIQNKLDDMNFFNPMRIIVNRQLDAAVRENHKVQKVFDTFSGSYYKRQSDAVRPIVDRMVLLESTRRGLTEQLNRLAEEDRQYVEEQIGPIRDRMNF